MCKPNKMSGWPKFELGHTGFGKLRRELNAQIDQREQETHHGTAIGPRCGQRHHEPGDLT